jgi:hypothetical protein
MCSKNKRKLYTEFSPENNIDFSRCHPEGSKNISAQERKHSWQMWAPSLRLGKFCYHAWTRSRNMWAMFNSAGELIVLISGRTLLRKKHFLRNSLKRYQFYNLYFQASSQTEGCIHKGRKAI